MFNNNNHKHNMHKKYNIHKHHFHKHNISTKQNEDQHGAINYLQNFMITASYLNGFQETKVEKVEKVEKAEKAEELELDLNLKQELELEKDLKQELKTEKIEKEIIKTEKIKTIEIKPLKPQGQDSLFWCFYICCHGVEDYQSLHKKCDLDGKRMKISYIEKVRNSKCLIKPYKLDTMDRIENNLLNEHKLTIPTFLVLCIIEKINILLYFNNGAYYSMTNDEDNEEYYIVTKDNTFNQDRFAVKKIDNKEFQTYQSMYYLLPSVKTGIKGIGNYTVAELESIAEKTKIPVVNELGKRKTKPVLYAEIKQHLTLN